MFVKFVRSGLVAASLSLAVPLGILTLAPTSGVAQVTAFKAGCGRSGITRRRHCGILSSGGICPPLDGRGDAYRARRAQLLHAIRNVEAHGLPLERYDPEGLLQILSGVRTARDRGMAEVELSRVFLRYARDIQTGMLTPNRIHPAMVREVPYRDRTGYLTGLASAKPAAFFRALPPRSMEYNALIKEKVAMERLLQSGGWGPGGACEIAQTR